jgi:orotidine-5'-phosphate decarboxylase
MSRFLDRLDAACAANESLLCVGLDVDPRQMPEIGVLQFNQAVVEATADLVCAYKPNMAFYEALGIPGLKALDRSLKFIRETAPQTLIIGDAKRGDIGPSGEAYARAVFQVWDFDAVTVNAWGGGDTIAPFLVDETRGAFIWCRGSNPGSNDLQDLRVEGANEPVPLYQHLASAARGWNQRDNLGLVVGATYPDQLKEVRRICPEMPLLVPGVGVQGGELAAAVRESVDANGRRAIINSSRGIIYASTGSDFAAAARTAAARMRREINEVLEAEGKGWR